MPLLQICLLNTTSATALRPLIRGLILTTKKRTRCRFLVSRYVSDFVFWFQDVVINLQLALLYHSCAGDINLAGSVESWCFLSGGGFVTRRLARSVRSSQQVARSGTTERVKEDSGGILRFN